MTGLPLIEINDDEAERITKAVLDLLAQYKIKMTGKQAAWLNLAGAAGAVYGVRIAMVLTLRKMQNAQQAQPVAQAAPVQSATVTSIQFPPE